MPACFLNKASNQRERARQASPPLLSTTPAPTSLHYFPFRWFLYFFCWTNNSTKGGWEHLRPSIGITMIPDIQFRLFALKSLFEGRIYALSCSPVLRNSLSACPFRLKRTDPLFGARRRCVRYSMSKRLIDTNAR